MGRWKQPRKHATILSYWSGPVRTTDWKTDKPLLACGLDDLEHNFPSHVSTQPHNKAIRVGTGRCCAPNIQAKSSLNPGLLLRSSFLKELTTLQSNNRCPACSHDPTDFSRLQPGGEDVWLVQAQWGGVALSALGGFWLDGNGRGSCWVAAQITVTWEEQGRWVTRREARHPSLLSAPGHSTDRPPPSLPPLPPWQNDRSALSADGGKQWERMDVSYTRLCAPG